MHQTNIAQQYSNVKHNCSLHILATGGLGYANATASLARVCAARNGVFAVEITVFFTVT